MQKQTRKDDLVETAHTLFNEYGYHATGIDRILEKSGVSKATMYKHFRSKEELILEVLRRRHRQFEQMVIAGLEKFHTKQPDAEPGVALLAIFDLLSEWIRSDHFYGCNFINASAEYGKPDDPIHRYAAAHKQEFKSLIDALLIDAQIDTGIPERSVLSEQLLILIDGAIVNAQVRGDRDSAEKAKAAAAFLLGRQR